MADDTDRSFGRPRATLADRAVRDVPALDALAARGPAFQPLPHPTRTPFEINLEEILPQAAITRIHDSGRMVFQTVGDSGGVKDPKPQLLVANCMEDDFHVSKAAEQPSFFYHLGDVVYFNGEAREYYPQFYLPYEHYTAPIMAIPGNHDGNPLGGETSLEAFVRNFCAATPHITPDADEDTRDAMTQPNVYWTLHTPLATLIGLYSNVPEGGEIRQDQQKWLNDQLAKADAKKPVVLSVHHPLFSLDDHHSGSAKMISVVEAGIAASHRVPDMVLTGHVHNYQRFTWSKNSHDVPVMVAGAGGYHNLHHMVKSQSGERLVPPVKIAELNITLESFLDDRHGYLLLEVTKDTLAGRYFGAPRPQEAWSSKKRLIDRFTLDWKHHKMLTN